MERVKEEDADAAGYYKDEINAAEVVLSVCVIVCLHETPYTGTPYQGIE
jgi:hypothetical protein